MLTAGADQSRLSVWLVDGDVYCRGLLKFALTEQNFAHSCVLLVASLTRPWDIVDSLTRWSDVLSTHIQRLKLANDVRRQREDASMSTVLSLCITTVQCGWTLGGFIFLLKLSFKLGVKPKFDLKPIAFKKCKVTTYWVLTLF